MKQNKKRKILVTHALPYANGEIHLGHLVEAIQTDIWVRFQRMQGHDCLFICGNDAHGTAIMLAAEKQDISPETLIERVHADHTQVFQNFFIDYDNFYTTHSPENKALSIDIYEKLKANGDITTKTITQAYDPEKELFLSDRFIRGNCPKCDTEDQYGDNCEACGATYSPSELKNARSALSGATPIEKESLHYFFELGNYSELLEKWLEEGRLQEHVVNKLKEWFTEGLRAWDISRDAPYFGFEIPDAPGKYFYVWLDAPVGYMASLKNLCDRRDDINFDEYWNPNNDTELYHFIGKDIVYFHSLFWPAMLHGAGYRMPTAIFVHGFLTINGQKMSKSRGTFITANEYTKHLNPEYLRYYYAAKLTNQVEDIDFSFEDFTARVNADLVGKYVNLASRCAGFITKKFDGKLASELHDKALFDETAKAGEQIAEHYENLNYNRAVREIMALADRANQYVDHHKPWALAKEDGRESEIQAICTQGLNLFRQLSIYLKPILPATAERVEAFLNIPPMLWEDRNKPLLDHTIEKFKPLMQRIASEHTEAFA